MRREAALYHLLLDRSRQIALDRPDLAGPLAQAALTLAVTREPGGEFVVEARIFEKDARTTVPADRFRFYPKIEVGKNARAENWRQAGETLRELLTSAGLDAPEGAFDPAGTLALRPRRPGTRPEPVSPWFQPAALSVLAVIGLAAGGGYGFFYGLAAGILVLYLLRFLQDAHLGKPASTTEILVVCLGLAPSLFFEGQIIALLALTALAAVGWAETGFRESMDDASAKRWIPAGAACLLPVAADPVLGGVFTLSLLVFLAGQRLVTPWFFPCGFGKRFLVGLVLGAALAAVSIKFLWGLSPTGFGLTDASKWFLIAAFILAAFSAATWWIQGIQNSMVPWLVFWSLAVTTGAGLWLDRAPAAALTAALGLTAAAAVRVIRASWTSRAGRIIR